MNNIFAYTLITWSICKIMQTLHNTLYVKNIKPYLKFKLPFCVSLNTVCYNWFLIGGKIFKLINKQQKSKLWLLTNPFSTKYLSPLFKPLTLIIDIWFHMIFMMRNKKRSVPSIVGKPISKGSEQTINYFIWNTDW